MINIHKKNIFKGVYIAFFIFLFCSINSLVVKAATPTRNVSMSPHTLTLTAGGATAALHALVLPSNATNKSVTWRSSNEAVAAVSSSGVVTPKSEGMAVIIVKTVDGGYTDACIVNVTIQPVTGISLDKNQATIKMGTTLTLKPTITPNNASNKTIIWTSSNESVVKVSPDGVVTPVSPGYTSVVARTGDGNHVAFCAISVIQGVDSVTLNHSSVALNLGDSVLMEAAVKPDNVTNKDVIWTSSNPVVAYVNYQGKLVSVSKGTTVITAASAQDPTKRATCSVKVNAITHVQKVSLNLHQANILAGQNLTLSKTVLPNDADDKTVTWSSTDEAVAAVSSSGVVTAKASGTVFIIVKSNDTGSADICQITVTVQPVTEISLDKNQTTIKMGTTLTLKPTIFPNNASNKAIIWTSGNESIVKVGPDGVVTPVSPGYTSVVARTEDGNYIAFCAISVIQGVDSVTLNHSSVSLNLGDSVSMEAAVEPDNASNKNIIWTSSNPAVAYVNYQGKLVSLSKGTTVITAASAQDPTKRATCSVKVNAITHVQKVSLNLHQANMLAGQNLTLSKTVLPNDADDKTVTWSSTDEAVAAVSSSGVVTAKASGTVFIIVKSNDTGSADICQITVTVQPVTGISLDKNQATIKMGTTLTLKPTIFPNNASNKKVTWISGDDSVAKVSPDGVVTPVSPGNTAVVARTEDGNYTAFCNIFVVVGVDSVSLNVKSLNMKIGDPGITLNAVVKPDDATNKNLIWKSSNPSIAIVGSDGKVYPLSPGSATITATSAQDPAKSASCAVRVAPVNTSVRNVDLNTNSANLLVGDTIALSAVITPGNATNKKVIWSSSNKDAAVVDSNGKVTAVSPGIAVIVARAEDGGPADACIVNVSNEKVAGVSLSSHQETLKMGSTLALKAVISPEKATNKNIEWTSGNPLAAKVDSNGMVTPEAPGVTVIMARTEDGNYTDYCIVYVIQGVDNITLDKNNVTISLSSPGVKLNASVNPYNASNKDVIWKSSNPNVVVVSSDGYIYPVSGGTAVITVTSAQDKTKSASCTVNVTVPVTGVEIY